MTSLNDLALRNTLAANGLETETLRVLFSYFGNDVYVLDAPRPQAIETWQRLRSLISLTGRWPVIGWDHYQGPPWDMVDPARILELASQIDAKSWLSGNALSPNPERDARGHELPPFTFQIHRRTKFPFTWGDANAPIALIPVSTSWEAPVYLQLGGMDTWGGHVDWLDDAPNLAPHVHVAVLKYWYERWGAELVAATSGSLELRVLHPPTTESEALDLAHEQHAYCGDLIEQITVSVGVLAKMLLRGSVWYFWWD